MYDTTFDYDLAWLNLDTHHEDAGFRTADGVLPADTHPDGRHAPGVERAVRPQRARPRRRSRDPVHDRSEAVNDRLAGLEASYLETEAVAVESNEGVEAGPAVPTER